MTGSTHQMPPKSPDNPLSPSPASPALGHSHPVARPLSQLGAMVLVCVCVCGRESRLVSPCGSLSHWATGRQHCHNSHNTQAVAAVPL